MITLLEDSNEDWWKVSISFLKKKKKKVIWLLQLQQMLQFVDAYASFFLSGENSRQDWLLSSQLCSESTTK